MRDKIFYLIFFSFILAFSRVIPHPPNFTPILASAVMGPLLIKDRLYGTAIPIIAMFISDTLIGFHPYQFAIYFTILTISLISPMKKKYKLLGFMAISASVWFFVTTNFAVWVIWDFYPKTLEGLITCYESAIPFFKNTLISTLLFTGLLFILSNYLETINNKIFYYFTNVFYKAFK